jgi:hypothetical protein
MVDLLDLGFEFVGGSFIKPKPIIVEVFCFFGGKK